MRYGTENNTERKKNRISNNLSRRHDKNLQYIYLHIIILSTILS